MAGREGTDPLGVAVLWNLKRLETERRFGLDSANLVNSQILKVVEVGLVVGTLDWRLKFAGLSDAEATTSLRRGHAAGALHNARITAGCLIALLGSNEFRRLRSGSHFYQFDFYFFN